MGVYGEYLNQPLARNFGLLSQERKKQLSRISQARGGRDVLVFAADISKGVPGTSIEYADLAPLNDLVANLKGKRLDLILETPGGSGEVVEDIVRLLHGKYEELAVIVPGWAKSAGTLLTMAADEILMGPTSALGPIDAQLLWQGKRFSADALLESFEKIKGEVEQTGTLNKAYIPMLQGISPGELQAAQNALDFAKRLTREWLVKYKFKNWTTHHTDQAKLGQAVTEEEKMQRAEEIASKLGDHRRWLTHGRSLNSKDLTEMRLVITDYTADAKLSDAIARYHALMQISFSTTNLHKIFETSTDQILKFVSPNVAPPPMQGVPNQFPEVLGAKPTRADIDVKCKCGTNSKVQLNLNQKQPLQPGRYAFPADDRFTCPKCGMLHVLTDVKRQVEAQTKQRIVPS
jgi:ClpP class serine protease